MDEPNQLMPIHANPMDLPHQSVPVPTKPNQSKPNPGLDNPRRMPYNEDEMGLKTSMSTLEKHLRQHKALELRLAGLTLQEVADKAGYRGPSGAYQGIQAALRRDCPLEKVEEMRAVMNARLLRLLKAVWPLAIGEKKKPDLNALDRALKLLERLCRLHGLDKPIEIRSDMTITAEDPLENLGIEKLGNLAEIFTKFTPEDIEFLTQDDTALDTGGDGEEPPDYR